MKQLRLRLRLWNIIYCLQLLTLSNSLQQQHQQQQQDDLSFNNVCISNFDCQIININDTNNELPIFCLNKFQCLCNKLQTTTTIATATTYKLFYKIIDNCYSCNQDNDQCMKQDPFSKCNNNNGQCECLNEWEINQLLYKNLNDDNDDGKKQSICFHNLIESKFESMINLNNTVMTNFEQNESTTTDLILATFFCYIFPFASIALFFYFIYRTFYRQGDDRNSSEMILYQAL